MVEVHVWLDATSLKHAVAEGHTDYADPGTMELHVPKGHPYKVMSKKRMGNRTHVVAHSLPK